MRSILLLITLLLPGVNAIDDTRPIIRFKYDINDPEMKCTASGAFDDFYHHYDNSCGKLGIVSCVGEPVKLWERHQYRWTCRFKDVEGYFVNTRVDEDHKTLHVDMTPRAAVHPVLYVLGHVVLLVMGIFVCYSNPQFVIGYALGSSSSSDPKWVEQNSWSD